VLTAIYNGDTDFLGSSDSEDHTVTLYNTVTTILSDLPDPSVKGEPFIVVVQVTSSVTATGTVSIDGGGGVKCTIPLANGAGNCTLNVNQLGVLTLTATYNPDSSHLGSVDTETHTVIDATPTPTPLPTATTVPTSTPIPTKTVTPTPTFTPTIIPSAVTSCNLVTHGAISLTGGVMSMTISNPYPFSIVMQDVTVTWNDDKGNNVGNKQLYLTQAIVGSTVIWTGQINNAATYTIPTTAIIPSGTTTITFGFQDTYDNRDGTERIYINLLTPGCAANPIDSSH
jgi:hypothetical protein